MVFEARNQQKYADLRSLISANRNVLEQQAVVLHSKGLESEALVFEKYSKQIRDFLARSKVSDTLVR